MDRLHWTQIGSWLRWSARALGTTLVVLVVALFVGETAGGQGPFPLSALSPIEQMMFVALAAMLIGVALAWRWDVTGGSITIAAGLSFIALDAIGGSGLHVTLVPGLFILSGVMFVLCRWACPTRQAQ
jgi:hypothetical protein